MLSVGNLTQESFTAIHFLHLLRSSETRQFSALIIRRMGWRKCSLARAVARCWDWLVPGPELGPQPSLLPTNPKTIFLMHRLSIASFRVS